ncbi:MAG: TonB-dependent receptor plug domain-containing protein [Myxococcales bacterium]|nr:TonB-dependent receptor plug domain-containing protein [Myxococcales bacterium]
MKATLLWFLAASSASVAEALPAASPDAGVSSDAGAEEVEEVVVAATQIPQRVDEVPSIVSVVTREEILSMGYRSVGEVLRQMVGFEINDNGHWPDTGVRGVNDATTYGDKIRMLVDGHNTVVIVLKSSGMRVERQVNIKPGRTTALRVAE